jgi:hypothetical protein
MKHHGVQNCPAEWGFSTSREYDDPFSQLELDVVFVAPDGKEIRVPAFWAGKGDWRVRFAGRQAGTFKWRTACSDPENADLDGLEGTLEVSPYEGTNPLYQHGPLRVSADGRYFEHLDATPFFWLGDTWWWALCKRLAWPADFRTLTADRVAKGYNVVQLFAGPTPDVDAFDERVTNEAGWPWEPEFRTINPGYFDLADIRIDWLVRSGVVPCIFGAQGYYMSERRIGLERLKRMWRYIVARYGAYPVVWATAGEVIQPHWLYDREATGEARVELIRQLREGWNQLHAYLRRIDPYHHPLTSHPCHPMAVRDSLDDELLDFDMLQTGHHDRTALAPTVEETVESYARQPIKPVVNGEVCYEAHCQENREEVQRLMFWVSVLSGARGFTYGAEGVFQANTRRELFGKRGWGPAWGNRPWEDTFDLPGSRQLGLAKALLERYRWSQLEPHPEWVEPAWNKDHYALCYAAGIPEQLRIVFVPIRVRPQAILYLEPGVTYRAFWFDVTSGEESSIGGVRGDAEGTWQTPHVPVLQDWLLVLEAEGARV